MKILFANTASTTLVANPGPGNGAPDYAPTATDFYVAPGTGALFPQPAFGVEYFVATLENSAGAREHVRCIGRLVDRLYLVRADDLNDGDAGAALTWTANDRISMRPTAGTMQAFLQNDGDQLKGPLDANSQEISDGIYVGGELRGVTMKGPNGASTANAIVVPNYSSNPNTSAPTIGGNKIWHQGIMPLDYTPFYTPPGTIVMWFKPVAPPGWWLCDGTKPTPLSEATPDLRGRVVIGLNKNNGTGDPGMTGAPTNTYDILAKGGTNTPDTQSSGEHDHGDYTGGTALTAAQIPAHRHRVPLSEAGMTPYGRDETKGTGNWGNRDTDYDNPVAYTDQGQTMTTDEASGQLKTVPDTHRHTISDDGAHTHELSTNARTPYIVLSFIIKLTDAGVMPT
jgi:hypothetical protein